jgi:hypothetical protein
MPLGAWGFSAASLCVFSAALTRRATAHRRAVTVVESGREAIEALRQGGADYQLILTVRLSLRRATPAHEKAPHVPQTH